MLGNVDTNFLVKGTRGEYRISVKRNTEAGRTTTCFDIQVIGSSIVKRVWNKNDLAYAIAMHENAMQALWDNVPVLREIESTLLDHDI